jgi:small subunit ribosomal protein S20
MANTAQARKRARQSEKNRAHNDSLHSELRTALKKVRKAIAGGDKAAAQAALDTQRSIIDSIAAKGIVHSNTTDRYKSRMQAAIKALA